MIVYVSYRYMLYMLHSMYTSMVYIYPIIHASTHTHTTYLLRTTVPYVCLISIAYTCKCRWDVVLWYIGIYHVLQKTTNVPSICL